MSYKRPPGMIATNGRRAGTRNKINLFSSPEFKDRLGEMKEGETPLDFILRLMRDEAEPKSVRLRCAIEAAPYFHSKMPTLLVTKDADVKTPEQWLEELQDVTETPKMIRRGEDGKS